MSIIILGSSLLISVVLATPSFRGSHLRYARGVSVATNIPSGWSYIGCQSDSVSQRTLTGAQWFDQSVKPASCINFCSAKGFTYAGVEYSDQCFCGDSLASSIAEPDGDCQMPCGGDDTQACGGSNRLSVYWSGQPPPNPAVVNPGPGNWTSVGCYVDSRDARTLWEQVPTVGGNAQMSVAHCTDACYQEGFMYAGVEYSSECWCGTWVNGQPATDGRCNMLCNGNTNEYCGGADGLNIYGYGLPKPPVACPQWDQYNETLSTGAVVLYECYTDHAGSDLRMTYEQSYESCATTCAKTYGCKAFSWLPPAGGPCYMKSSVGTANPNNGVWGGRVINAVAASPVPSSTPSSTAPRPAPTGTLACPDWDESTYNTTNGGVALIECFVDHAGGDLSMEYVDMYADCVNLCSATTGCLAFSFDPPKGGGIGGPCYMKSSVGQGHSNTNVWGGKMLALAPPPRTSSSAVSSGAVIASSSSTTVTISSGLVMVPSSSTPVTPSNNAVPVSSSTSSILNNASLPSASVTASSSSVEIPSSSFIPISSMVPSSSVQDNLLPVSSAAPSSDAGASISSLVFSSSTTSTAPASSSSVAPHWYYVGCYTDATAKRALSYTPPLPNGNSVENCQTACKTAGYLLAGMEYGAECYCGNNVGNGQGPAPNGEAGCNMACQANTAEICGGGNRLSLWAWSTWSPPSTSTVSMSSVSASATPLPSIPANWTYAGCYFDNVGGYGRVMQNEQSDDNTMTIASCVTTCSNMGYSVAGMEYADQCFCDNYLRNGAGQATDTDCNMPCAGDSTSMCGAGDRLTVWSNGPLTVLPVPTIPKHLPANWSYVGCLFDSVTAARPLGYKAVSDNNTVANCISTCQKYGFPAAGVEYGEECYCGDYSDVWATGPQIQPDSECNMPCTGNASELCGTGGRLQTYFYNSTTPLNDWQYATGSDAGEYQYMMGGLVVPLMATLGINDKVSFLEKHGTGPPNSTGAYELDYRDGNYQTAWRTMHVKTDVFCAASIILPDRSGRQLNVGGWSTNALTGIRLYTPDGSPGNASVNDWQENWEELGLQNGRWYPTAMVMYDGQVLVIGGQDGSNGPPVPTLETLPPRGPPLFCQWLKDSDPWNLYPFLAVIRGGIFVEYWNEARILDENTFETIRVLPPVPGAVNEPKGGRTYPLEGTMVLLPQHAPYTDNLEVLICGGSTNDNNALDNCVSTRPEDPNAEWVIERMPSKRVITCMAALPDGTYFMTGGAQRGQAGFALADMPNFSAMLYDPRKPVGSRMTVMANTTIERLYHSEAILLNDGRVLISGSDPQDTRFPEQYIIEQFLPSYLLNGKPRPSFVLNDRDWSYGETVTVTGIVAPINGVGSVTFSMLGAISSTHSNSMGQRTIFPAVSCSGSSCTITAPPEAHIAPPGWFQLFALDDGQPSQGIWIRLGKDPGQMGSWPAGLDDFAPLPGQGDYVPWF